MLIWLITGCSTGLGRALAETALADGHRVVVTARRVESVHDLVEKYPSQAIAAPLDVRDSSQVEAAVRAATDAFGRVDVLVNNAGHGYRAAVEEGEDAALRELFDTNLFGAIAMIRAVLPGMRERGAGTIVNVSSMAAQGAAPGSGFYAATKAALEQVSVALRAEVAPLGISVMVVEPGAFRTDFAGRSLTQPQVAISAYAQTAGLRRKENDTTHGTQPNDPELGGRVIIDAVVSEHPPFRLLLGSDAVDYVRAQLTRQLDEISAWEATSRTTAFQPG
jgi:NAD(P)-dependent dehydrogenase (short-subunit alcohol dehydrogenase family)